MTPKNILFLFTDQQRADTIGAYRSDVCRTPHLDALAGESTVFTRAYTPIAICAPARSSLLTGVRPHRHGILRNDTRVGPERVTIGEKWPTYSRLLRAAGRRCVHLGKWHIGQTEYPHDFGFEGMNIPGYGNIRQDPGYMEFLASRGITRVEPRNAIRSVLSGGREEIIAGESGMPEEASEPHYLGREAIRYLESFAASGEPFFMECNFWGPHLPYVLPEPYHTMYAPGNIPRPANFDDELSGKPNAQAAHARYWGLFDEPWEVWARLLAGYYGYVSLIDAQIGRVLARLEELGLAEDTLVVFATDHGSLVGWHRMIDKGPAMYEESYRIPLIIRLPGAEPQVRDDYVYLTDLMPTFLEIAGLEVPETCDFVSLADTLRGGAGPGREEIFAAFYGHQFPYEQRMLLRDNLKLVVNPSEFDELYDLEKDPGELVNLIRDPACAGPRRELLSRMKECAENTDDPARWLQVMR